MMATTAADTATITDSASRNRPTRIAVERVNGRARIRTLDRGYFLTARPLQTSGSRIRIALIGVHMSLLGGDVIDLRIRADDGVTVELIEPVGLVAYNAEGRRADWRLSASLGTGAALIWHGCQFIAAQGSNAHRRVDLELDEQARALFMETLVLGRSGETDVQLRSRNHVTQTGSELLVEDLDLNPRTRHAPGLIGPAKAISTVIAAGWRPEGNPEDPNRLDLAGPGALYRALANGAHATENIVKPVFTHWHNEILQTRRQN